MKRIALIGNPNTGKTSLFNKLTGLNQNTGNYPGVTVDKTIGHFSADSEKYELIDLPGTYSLEPHSKDEEVVLRELLSVSNRIDSIIYIAEAGNLRRNLFLFTQIKDLGIPVQLVINRADKVGKLGIDIDIQSLSDEFDCPVSLISVKNNQGLENVKADLKKCTAHHKRKCNFPIKNEAHNAMASLKGMANNYIAWLYMHQASIKSLLADDVNKSVDEIIQSHSYSSDELLKSEANERYAYIDRVLEKHIHKKGINKSISHKIDLILTHKYYGFLIFMGILFFMFQSIFSWSSIPMDFIDQSFSSLSSWASQNLPANRVSELISEAVIPGVGGVVIFVPQIAILFGFISLLEQSGYMSRVVFIMDHFMRKFGLNGKSIVPLMSGIACAIPAVMAARNIDNPKERLLTILVTPFMTCAARLPVYTILIALMAPSGSFYGFNLQGLLLMLMYLLGFLTSIFASVILNKFIKSEDEGHFIIEMPSYQWPQINNLVYTLFSKTKTFVFEAGKMIVAVSVIIWVLASYGPTDKFKNTEAYVTEQTIDQNQTNLEDAITAYKLEHSYLGYLGKGIEPLIAPLGYDWKIGVGILSSFVAREVFVGTMASLYSVGSKQEDETTILERLKSAKNPKTGQPIYTFAVSLSLLMFYAFAMQCVSTIAIVKRETNSWKWPILQTIGMTGFAYIVALITFNIFS